MVSVYELLFGWVDIIRLALKRGDEPLERFMHSVFKGAWLGD